MSEHLKYTACFNGVSLGETLGITREEIETIVYNFYGKVRQDALLGPVFEEEMTEDWDHHLPKMVNFWSSVMFSKPFYKGDPLEAHRRVSAISRTHFGRWLELFRQTVDEVCPSKEHADAFFAKATNMGRAMTFALGLPAQS